MKTDVPRIIGEYHSGTPGALLWVTAGVHGNEPSGVIALQRVFRELERSQPNIKGTLVGVSGNREALKKNVRFIDEDLNRIWNPKNLNNEIPETSEQIEMGHIIGALNRYPKTKYSKRHFLDCHTTSSESLPYISVQEVNDNDTWAHRFPTYIVRGFSDLIQGDIDHYLSCQGLTGFVFEGGQHNSENAVENHEGMIWLALKKALDLSLTAIECYPDCIENFTTNAPAQRTFEIAYRHHLRDTDDFKMLPGFKNFNKIDKGELLAIHNGKEVCSSRDGHIFMPLYQPKGNDGFFIINEVSSGESSYTTH